MVGGLEVQWGVYMGRRGCRVGRGWGGERVWGADGV